MLGREGNLAVGGAPPYPADGAAGEGSGPSAASGLIAPPLTDGTNRKNMIALIQLRWIAILGQIVTIAAVRKGLGIDLPLRAMALVLAALVVLNLASLAWLRQRTEVSSRALLIALVFDVCALTAQLWLSGGATNPFTSLYLLQVTLAAVLLEAWPTWAIVGLSCASVVGLIVSYRPLLLPPANMHRLLTLQIAGMFVCFALVASLLVVFVTRITRNLRERDAGLAALRQHAAEEDHVVRMGLLAAGAAHELGTPLAQLSVILGDWRHMEVFTANAEVVQELDEMRVAVDRCKTIVTGILLAAGEARGEAPVVTTVRAFLDEVVDEWRATHASIGMTYENKFGTDLAIVIDTTLKQLVFNVLENAAEASPSWVGFTAEREGDALQLRIKDVGPGFSPEMLAQFGKPYQSTKGRRGGGLGLFLVVNVVRKLGGSVRAHNRFAGGAEVVLNLPLAALTIGGTAHER